MISRWDRHFLQLCLDHARMSKDPSTRVGAVIIGPDREPVSDGFNGFPRGIADRPELLNNRDEKMRRIIHAEENAILNAVRLGHATKGCTLYLAATDDTGLVWGGPPCSQCVLKIIHAGIVGIVSYPKKSIPSRWHADLEFSRALIDEVGLAYREVTP
jgi:dCMP deaminase